MAAISRMRVGSPSTRKVSASAWAVSADSGGATGAGSAAADSGAGLRTGAGGWGAGEQSMSSVTYEQLFIYYTECRLTRTPSLSTMWGWQ